MIKSATFRGRRFKVSDVSELKEKLLGLCSNPSLGFCEMHIPIDGDTKDDLAVIIHESLHACYWDMDEDAVEDGCMSIANLLWRLGWRKEDSDQ